MDPGGFDFISFNDVFLIVSDQYIRLDHVKEVLSSGYDVQFFIFLKLSDS